jgi:hypothetical protein
MISIKFSRRQAFTCVAKPLAALLIISGLAGCGNSGSSNNSSSTSGSFVSITGNWELDTTSTSGGTPFTTLAGFFNELGTDPVNGDFISAALQVQSTTCYTGSPNVPIEGLIAGNTATLVSFPVDGQVIAMTATKNSAGNQMTGTYTITGGCANGEAGSFTGTLYSPVNGTYGGTATSNPAKTLKLTLAQNTAGSGNGEQLASGSAVLTGFCFTSATLQTATSYVLGSNISLTFTTNEAAGSQITMTGTINTAASALTISSINVTGGSCSGSFGAATLSE